MYSEVEDTLQKIHENGIKNIVITDNENGAVWVRENILKKFKINDFIALVVTSKEAGVSKPDPFIFNYALKQYNLHKNEVVFVAHDKDEIDGAVKFGIKVIEYNNYLNYKTLADRKINSFLELLEEIG